MWNFASNCLAGGIGLKDDSKKPTEAALECSDDEISSISSREEGLECPICWESFNIVENVPYVLWCGHTLCKNCILGLQWAVVKFPTLPIQLPLFISCPWCNLLSPRLVYRGNLMFPRKNFFLLWMVESLNGDRMKSHSGFCGGHRAPMWLSNCNLATGSPVSHHAVRRGQYIHYSDSPGSNHPVSHHAVRRGQYIHYSESPGSIHDHNTVNDSPIVERLHPLLKKSLTFFFQLTAKFPLVLIFLLIVLYAIPASAAILALYVLITVLFALPSLLILYFSYPSLDWLVREIIA